MARKTTVSPRGILVFPYLNTPDTKFDDDGVYITKLKLKADSKEAKKLMKEIDDKMAESLVKAREEADTPKKKKMVKPCEDRPYTLETDDNDDETGYVLFTFKMKATGTNRKTGEEYTRKPALFDAAGEPLDEDEKIGGGTEAKISYEIAPFYTVKLGAGVSIRMYAVQVLKLVSWGGGDAESYGFGDESEFPADDADNDGDEDAEEEEEKPRKKSKAPAPAKKKKKIVEEDDDDEEDDDEDDDEDEKDF